ncbi:hypothetical protein K2181_22235 [Clostridium estertheticum]|nr:hypothetical protein [Clostridium estertheticum]WLC82327.1 hypothetical protein KTC98_22925 [Clostridium estertheticum]
MLLLNNYMYAQSNKKAYYSTGQQLKLMQSLNNLVKRNLNNASKVILNNNLNSDSISIENGKHFIANRQQLSSLTQIQGKDIEQFTPNDNILNLDKGSFYKLKTSSGTTAILTVDEYDNVYMPFSQLGLDTNFTLVPSDYGEINKASRLLSSLLKDKSAFLVNTGGYSDAEVKSILGSVGIKPGAFQVNGDGKSNKFYLTDSGLIYPDYQIKEQNLAFKQTNWFKDERGYSSDSKFIINGETYKLDEKGYLNLPDGVDCVMENIKIIK